VTEQNNIKAKQVIANHTVVQAQAVARSNIAKAGGESHAIKIITEQLKPKDIHTYRHTSYENLFY